MKGLKLITYLFFLCFIVFAPFAKAWEGHALLTLVALQNMKELKNLPDVPAETLDSFVQKEKTRLGKILDDNEKWSIQHIIAYAPLPKALEFDVLKKQNIPLKTAFMETIRINPTLNFPLFIENLPGFTHHFNNTLSKSAIMLPELINEKSLRILNLPLEKVNPGDKLSPLEIITSSADEPDWGMDINLWSTDHTWFGKQYGFGKQLWGNPKVFFTGQTQFHMGFYYEPSYFYKLSPSLKHFYPEYRIHLYLTLSKFAFQTGHPYWGYRFLGWALHYVQDLTQPYHSTLAPNVKGRKLIGIDLLKLIFIKSPAQHLIQIESNSHFSLENYEYFKLAAAIEKPNENKENKAIIQALSNSTIDSSYPPYDDNYPRKIVAKESHAKANLIDETIHLAFPSKYITDPNYIFYETDPNINMVKITEALHNPSLKDLDNELLGILGSIGAHTRNFVRYGLSR